MSYKFVMGGSGSGKTHTILKNCIQESLKYPDKRYVILVPEQYSLQIQKQVVRLHPNHATENIDVLTFKRLAYKVFGELGVVNPEVIDDSGKAMIIRKVTQNCDDKLVMWKGQYTKAGHIDSLKSTISEFMQYGITPDAIDAVSTKVQGTILKNKLKDLYTIYDAFKRYIEDKYITDEEISDILVEKLPYSKRIIGTTVVLIGFTGFTPVQYRLLEIILAQAQEVIAEITMGDEENPYSLGASDDLFAMSKTMISKIIDIGSKIGVSEDGSIRLNKRPYPRYTASPELDEFEKHFLRYDGYKISPNKDEQRVRILSSLTVSQEITAIASLINKLVRVDGYRYRNIAIVSGALDEYESVIRPIFDKKDIPYYIDSNISIDNNPLPEYLKAILGVVSDNYSYDSIARLCGCGLVDDNKNMIPYMLNYMLQLGIEGYKKMTSEWNYVPREFADIDMTELVAERDRIISMIDPLKTCYTVGKAKVSDISVAIISIMNDNNVFDKLQTIASNLYDTDHKNACIEYDKIYTEVVDLISRMDDLLGDEVIGKDEYEGLIDSGLSQISIGMIPACVDRVIVGDITRTRLDDVKAMILVGASDGILLQVKGSGYIVNDNDKECLNEMGVELAPTAKEDLFIQRYYLYRLLTMASESLTISYSGMDSAGGSRKPSGIISLIRGLYKEGLPSIQAQSLMDIYTLDDAAEYVIDKMRDARADGTLGKYEPEVCRIIGAMSADEDQISKIDRIIEGTTHIYSENGIGREAALKLFGESIKASTTRLETYARCPFEHFAKYGLLLHERSEFSIDRSDVGTLLHDVLSKLFDKVKADGKNIASISTDEMQQYTEISMKQALLDDEADRYSYSARNRYLARRLEHLVTGALNVLSMQLRKGDFVPEYFELPFSADDGLSALNIQTKEGNKIELRGVIDRVDLCKDEDKTYVKIIDYKTGDRDWDKGKLIAGTQLQLAIYLDAVTQLIAKRNKKDTVLPAAMLYSRIDSPIIDISNKHDTVDIDSKLLEVLRPSGLVCSERAVLDHLDKDISDSYKSLVIPVKFDKDGGIIQKNSSVATSSQMEDLREYVRKVVSGIGSEILSGDVKVSPVEENSKFNACSFCGYRQVCGFDNKVKGYRFRNITKLDDATAWKEISGDDIKGES